jgi:hypothetical protein
MSKELLNFKVANQTTSQPNLEECGFSGKQCFEGSSGRECTIADHIFCPDWNNPAIYNICCFKRREEQYRADGITK